MANRLRRLRIRLATRLLPNDLMIVQREQIEDVHIATRRLHSCANRSGWLWDGTPAKVHLRKRLYRMVTGVLANIPSEVTT